MKQKIDKFRAFNRKFSSWIGVFNTHFSTQSLTATETRCLYEIGQNEKVKLSEIRNALSIDAGQLSRAISGLEQKKLVIRKTSSNDRRIVFTQLTKKGLKLLEEVSKSVNTHLSKIISAIPKNDHASFFQSMQIIQSLIEKEDSQPAYIIRERQPGDVGHVLSMHGLYYSEQNGFNSSLEGVVATDLSKLDTNKTLPSQLWIAELNFEPIGSVGIVPKSETVAQLHWLLVTPLHQNKGLGKQLLQMAINFSKVNQFKQIFLNTTTLETNARKLYQRFGFKINHSKQTTYCGVETTVETWQLNLN